MMASLGYVLLEWTIVACNGASSKLAQAVGRDTKAKLSLLVYAISIPLAFVRPWIAIVLYVAVALMWLVPDRRIESVLKE
jgi:uncharacterized membrane protein